jgi:hypothetical protein
MRPLITFKALILSGVILTVLVIACTKSPTTPPPVHDTVTVIKKDTIVKRDTIIQKIDTPNLKIGLLLYLPFNGSFADSSGNGNPTSVIGGATLTFDEHGYANSAFRSTGIGEKIKVTNNGSIQFDTAFSISYDFMQSSTGVQAFLTMINPTTAFGPSFFTGIGTGLGNFNFGADDATDGCDNTNLNNPKNVNDTTSFVPNPGSWYNTICIYHKGTLQIYINGKLIGTKTNPLNTTAILCPTSQVVVGAWWDGDPLSFNGKLDEIRLYNRVLAANEIAYLSRNFLPGSTKVNPSVRTR